MQVYPARYINIATPVKAVNLTANKSGANQLPSENNKINPTQVLKYSFIAIIGILIADALIRKATMGHSLRKITQNLDDNSKVSMKRIFKSLSEWQQKIFLKDAKEVFTNNATSKPDKEKEIVQRTIDLVLRGGENMGQLQTRGSGITSFSNLFKNWFPSK